MELSGICPESRAPGRRRAVTRLLELSHVTPCHKQGDGLEMFHRSVFPRTAERNLVSANLSAMMSEKEISD